MAAPILEVRDLTRHFRLPRRAFWRPAPVVRAVDGVSFDIRQGETLALVGESGSGKSTIARLILRLITPTSGSILFQGRDLARLDNRTMRGLRPDIQLVFQDPYSSLNPRKTVAHAVSAPLRAQGSRGTDRRTRVDEALRAVQLDPGYGDRYPHQLSGGQRQRVAIARAIVTRPRLVVADEPVSALDVSTRAQILNLLADLREEFGLSYLFISHDLPLVRHVADRTAVLYLGKLAEVGTTDSMFAKPLHPYSQALIASAPVTHPRERRPRRLLEGELPAAIDPPSGCRFHPRCPFARERCAHEEPRLETAGNGHAVACHFWREIAAGNAETAVAAS